jgi:hypothetical protein
MTLLFLALFLMVGIGQGLSRVRALGIVKAHFPTETDHRLRSIFHKIKRSGRAIAIYRAIVTEHAFASWAPIQPDFHKAYSDSARARRQGPRVLSATERSANT